MKNRFDRYWLFIVTLVFVILGSFVIYISLDRLRKVNSCTVGDNIILNSFKVEGYKEGFDCVCSDGQVVCSESNSTKPIPQVDMFVRDGLKVSAKYQSSGTNDNLSNLALKTRFTSVSVKNGVMDITLEQEQMCTNDGRIPIQVGLYYLSENNLYITNVVRQDPKIYFKQCVVSVNYKLNAWKKSVDNLKIMYISDEGKTQEASLCYYNKNIYASGDIYSSEDSCNICKCVDGISKCTNDRVCTVPN